MRGGIIFRNIAGIALLSFAAAAQQPGSAQIDALRQQLAAQRRILRDWGGLTRYGSDDSTIRPPAPGENRVVFLGDQITESWGRGGAPFFPGKPYFNRGIGGQTTPQMLVRFRQDVISLRPKVVVIQGGVNDLAGISGPATEEMVAENFMTMTELAKSHGIRVVIASMTPVCDCSSELTRKRSRQMMQGKIIEVNELLKDYAASSGSVYLDYYSALAAGREFKRELTTDGIVPNDAGYSVMAALAGKSIAEALGAK